MENHLFPSPELQIPCQWVGLVLGCTSPCLEELPKHHHEYWLILNPRPLPSSLSHQQFCRQFLAFVFLLFPLLYEPRTLSDPALPCTLSRNLPSQSLSADQPRGFHNNPLDSSLVLRAFCHWTSLRQIGCCWCQSM